MFSIVFTPAYIPTHGILGCPFLYLLPNAYFFLIIAILIDAKRYLTVVLFCIFLIISDVEHLRVSVAIVCLWENVYSGPLTIF